MSTQALSPPTSPATGHPLRRLGLAVILAVEVMDLLDATIVGVASPSIRADFGGSSTQIQWIAAAYTLAFSVLLITGARLGDIVGRRRMFLLGLAGFTVCSALCAAAGSAGTLIAGRAAQGLCAAMMVPQGLGILRQMFPPRERGAAFAAFGPVMGLAAVAGPVLGGFLTEADLLGTGWRSVFLINVPIGVLALAVALRILPEGRSTHAPRLDLPGSALVSLGVLMLVFPLVQGRDLGWPLWTRLSMAGAVPVLGLFAWHQRRVAARGGSPLVEPGLFRHRGFSAALVVGVVFFAAVSGLMLMLTLHLQVGLGYSALHAGASMIPWSAGTVVGAILSGGVLGPKYGRRTIQAGFALSSVAAAALALIVHLAGHGATTWHLLPALLLNGFAMGLVMAPFFDIALADVEERETGSASGVLNAVQQLGGAVGVAVLGTAFFSYAADGNTVPAARWTALMATAAFVAAWAAAFLMPRRARGAAAEH